MHIRSISILGAATVAALVLAGCSHTSTNVASAASTAAPAGASTAAMLDASTPTMFAAGADTGADATVERVVSRSDPDRAGDVVLALDGCFAASAGGYPVPCHGVVLVTEPAAKAPPAGSKAVLLRFPGGAAVAVPLPNAPR